MAFAVARAVVTLLLVSAVAVVAQPLSNAASETQSTRDVLLERLFGFFLSAGICTQTEWCNEGGYFVPLGSGCENTCEYASSFSNTLQPDGSWPDVAYNDTSKSMWKPFAHLERTVTLARAYHCSACTSSFRNKTLLSKTHSAFDFWLRHDYLCPNWWWNEIGVPGTIGAILTLLHFAEGGFQPDELRLSLASLDRAQNGTGSGENLVWTQQAAIVREVLCDHPDVFLGIFRAMWGNIKQTQDDGVQIDSSFHFHGPLLYTGGYGGDFALNLAVYANLTVGTSCAPTGQPLQVLIDYLLDGQQYAIRGNGDATKPTSYYDVSVKGREIVRAPEGNLLFPHVMASVVAPLADIYPSRANELKLFASRLQGKAPPLSGTRHFFRSDYTAHHRSKFAITLKMQSNRMLGNEVTNTEGLMSWHTASGATLVYLNGSEYRGIFPVWDWTRIPGTITRHDKNESSSKVHQMGSTSFVGGCSNGLLAVSCMNFSSLDFGGSDEQTPITALRSWFFVDEGVVVLATNVSLDAEQGVSTTFDQALQKTDVYTKGTTATAGPEQLPDGQHNVSGWVWHNTVLYSTPLASATFAATMPRLTVTVGNVSGAWSRISGEGTNDTVTRRVVTVEQPSASIRPTNERAAYAVLPGVELDQADATQARFWDDSVRVVVANDTAHALLYRQGPSSASTTLMATTWVADATVRGGHGFDLLVSHPVTLLLSATNETGGVQLSVSNPDNNPLTVTITIDRKLSGGSGAVVCRTTAEHSSTITVSLPGGPAAGSTVTAMCAEKRGFAESSGQ
eukprot:m.116150 g.116150  ORF g.116150 m.116150 type:complete len:792 (+) comp16373_c0_seq1:88-2463(+)